MSEWQPIETAPKDGTEVLAWYDSAPGFKVQAPNGYFEVVSWDQAEQDFTDTTGNGIGELLTHWMPLPAPPARGGEAG